MQPHIEPKLWQALMARDVATHEDLEDAIWGDCPDPPTGQRAMIRQGVIKLREKLPPGMALVNIHGIGYAMRPVHQAAQAEILLTKEQERLLRAIIRFDPASFEYIEQAMWGSRPTWPANPRKLLTVMACEIRKKLKPMGWNIANVWGVGYTVRRSDRAKVRQWLDAHATRRIDKALQRYALLAEMRA